MNEICAYCGTEICTNEGYVREPDLTPYHQGPCALLFRDETIAALRKQLSESERQRNALAREVEALNTECGRLRRELQKVIARQSMPDEKENTTMPDPAPGANPKPPEAEVAGEGKTGSPALIRAFGIYMPTKEYFTSQEDALKATKDLFVQWPMDKTKKEAKGGSEEELRLLRSLENYHWESCLKSNGLGGCSCGLEEKLSALYARMMGWTE